MLYPEIVIVGCGSPLFADDGFGPAVAEELCTVPFPDNVKVVDAGTSGTYFVFTLLDLEITKRLIVLDAADFGADPGSIALFRPRDLPPGCFCDPFSWDIADPLDLIRDRIDIQIIVCQPKQVTYPEVTIGLSEEVRAAIPRAARIVRDMIRGEEMPPDHLGAELVDDFRHP
jgi:coenzyme F420 hydrogenase subunit delta